MIKEILNKKQLCKYITITKKRKLYELGEYEKEMHMHPMLRQRNEPRDFLEMLLKFLSACQKKSVPVTINDNKCITDLHGNI